MPPENVTVSDSNGRLLNSGSQNSVSARARKEYEMEQKREKEYLQKIDSILIPILGMGNYTAQVDVTMDFTSVEQTQRRYNPDLPAVRSEQTSESTTTGGIAAGIPGALSNQPPLDVTIPEEAGGEGAAQRNPKSTSKEATRNFELDTTISHTKQQTGVLQRLSVSVAVDYISVPPATEEGEPTTQPRNQEELLNIRRVLQGGIGFDVARGDTLEVVSIPFNRMDIGAISEPPLWEQPRFMSLVKLGLSALVIIILILFVVRPMLKRLIDPASAQDASEFDTDEGLDLGDDLELLKAEFDEDQVGFASDGSLQMPDLRRDEDVLKAVRTLVANEPELAAQVVNGWLTMDE
jgi:flagellar M-ring protein FliF